MSFARPLPARLIAASAALVTAAVLAPAVATASPAADADSLYTALHPRLLFSRDQLPAMRARLHDGGADDLDYGYIHSLVDTLYPVTPLSDLMNQTFGIHFLLNIGLVSHLDDPPDAAALDLGRLLTIAVTDSFAPDDNVFYSPVRTRILSFGYDMCMDTATPAERALVRNEIEAYIDSVMTEHNYERWLHPPYVSNISAMIGSALGLAAICLSDELPAPKVAAALARADTFVAVWERHLLDPDGSCKEGVQYGAWSLNHLTYYFAARKRYDGTDYSLDPAIRAVERWLAYELLPEPGARVNNLNDTAYLNAPVTRHGTYVNWAMTAWSSGLAAWLWDRIFGTYGYDWKLNEDRASTVLWWRPIAQQSPNQLLPRAFLWKDRGLYYYRTGWPAGGASDDVVFTFYSGKFHGGHCQEDQNSFTLYAFGTRFAADNGFDTLNWRSLAHNMIFIDGNGQHHAGTTYGTDGRMADHVLTDYGDYLLGDATDAYASLSPYNSPGVPFPEDDWSAGDTGNNPVDYALRRWLVVHQGETPPYFVLLDDIKKDDAVRVYDWRMHTEGTSTVDIGADPIRISSTRGALDIDVVVPAPADVTPSVDSYVNLSADPDTRVLVLSHTADAAQFALVLRPRAAGASGPVATRTTTPWGGTEQLAWPGGPTDLIVANPARDTVSVDAGPSAPSAVSTDARLGQLRFSGTSLQRYILVDATTCTAGTVPFVRMEDASASIVFDGRVVSIDRDDAVFTLYGPGVVEVRGNGRALAFDRHGDFVSRGTGTPRAAPPALRVSAYPVPFRTSVSLVVESPAAEPGAVTMYDVAGRLVRHAWSGMLVGGRTFLSWDGRDDNGQTVASGVYFARARSGTGVQTVKIVLVR